MFELLIHALIGAISVIFPIRFFTWLSNQERRQFYKRIDLNSIQLNEDGEKCLYIGGATYMIRDNERHLFKPEGELIVYRSLLLFKTSKRSFANFEFGIKIHEIKCVERNIINGLKIFPFLSHGIKIIMRNNEKYIFILLNENEFLDLLDRIGVKIKTTRYSSPRSLRSQWGRINSQKKY